jgi:hypothetical protein
MTMKDRELTQIVQNHTGVPWFNGKAYVEYHGIKDSQAKIAELEGLIGRYANNVADANGVYFEPSGPEGEYIIGLAERAIARAALGDGV